MTLVQPPAAPSLTLLPVRVLNRRSPRPSGRHRAAPVRRASLLGVVAGWIVLLIGLIQLGFCVYLWAV